jgi:superfamily I DNA and/or RNA helicase
VIAATAIGVDSGRDGARVADLDFDVAIIDEASQAHIMDLVVPLSRARAAILVGDHRQLPPYLDEGLRQRCLAEGISFEWLETSVFELLWDRIPKTHRARLDVQFRMPAAIADFLGSAFYEGELASAPSKLEQHTPPVSDLFAAAVVFVDTSDDPRRAETPLTQGFLNRCEADLCAELGVALPADRSLGVIAPYAAQVGAIRQSLARAGGLSARDPWLVDNVATVDSFQGQERDVVIVSLTRSNPAGEVGFVSDLNRLNVTLSRAREQLVIVGDLSTLSAGDGGRRREEFATFIRDLVEHLRLHGDVISSGVLRARLTNG